MQQVNRNFWNGMAMGAAAGMMVGFMVMARRHQPTTMDRTKTVMGRTARHAMKRAQGAWTQMAGRFSD
jgi:hypothetical protein